MVKAFMIATISADGFIAKDSLHPVTWTGKADHHRFTELVRRAGIVVMSSKAYENSDRPVSEIATVVYSHSKRYMNAEATDKGPRELLHELGSRGFTEVAICGGSDIFTMFMKAGVIETVYLTIEPVIFGAGIPLFKGSLLKHFKLVSSAESASGAILLEYQVIREIPTR